MLNSLKKNWDILNSPWVFTLLLTILIFTTAEIGKGFGHQGFALSISPVWPATGFSLAAVILFGFRVAGPGIFLGNFLYNYLHLSINGETFHGPLLTALIISFGSLLQALIGGYIVRNYSTTDRLLTLKDVLILLIPGLAVCLIASTIGVAALYLYGSIPTSDVLSTWLLFWVGDSMGVFIFTPLLIIWSVQKAPLAKFKQHGVALLYMVAIFLVLSLLTFFYKYPVWHLFIPLILWITYYFRMHGATATIFLLTVISVIPFSIGYGAFNIIGVRDPLIVLISFLEIIVLTALSFAALMNERDASLLISTKTNKELATRGKFVSSLEVIAANLNRHIQIPHNFLNQFIKSALECFNQFELICNNEKDKLPKEIATTLHEKMHALGFYLHNIETYERHAGKIAKMIQEQSLLTANSSTKIKIIDMSIILEACLMQVQEDASKRYPGFSFSIITEFDNTEKKIWALTVDFVYALIPIFNCSIDSMKAKANRLGDNYKPILTVNASKKNQMVEVIIRDNGMGMSSEELEKFSETFFDEDQAQGGAGMIKEPQELTLALAHDIIVEIHHGKLVASSVEGEYLQIILTFPSEHVLTY